MLLLLLLFTYRKSHTVLPLVPKLMTSNKFQRRRKYDHYFASFHRRQLWANCVTMVEIKHTLSATNVAQKGSFRRCVIYGDREDVYLLTLF